MNVQTRKVEQLFNAVLGDQEKAVKYILTTSTLKALINEEDNNGNTTIITIITSDKRAYTKGVNKGFLTPRDDFGNHRYGMGMHIYCVHREEWL